jgi:repressor LexA
MESITKKQKEVFDFISDYSNTHGYAPTQKEIKEHFGLKSFGSVQRYLKYLVNAGYLECDWNARRGIRPSKNTQSENNEIPLLGLVAAGNPIEAIENPEETVSVPPQLLKSGSRYFALTVQGESMIEDGILEDDIIICRHQNTANQGQTVVAVVDGEATVKNYYRKRSAIELHPANSSMSPIIVNSGTFQIAGVLVGLLRRYE